MEGVAATGVGERAKGSKMADLEDVTLDGRPLHSLRVADLKTALEQRGLPKSGQKNALIKRLKGALMLENLQRTSTAHIGLQPNSQIGEEMSQNSFIKQYLAKQQELLRQRLEREAREAAEADDMDSPVGPDQEDHSDANDGTSCPQPGQEVSPVVGIQNKRHPFDQREEKDEGGKGWGRMEKAGEEDGAGETAAMEQASPFSQPNTRKAAFPPGQAGPVAGDAPAAEPEPQEVPGSRGRWSSGRQSHEDPTPSSPSAPPRAVASLSVRVVGDPERQGPTPLRPDPPAPAHSAPPPGLAPAQRAARSQQDSDDDSGGDEEEDGEEEEEDWAAPHSHPQLSLRQPTPPPSPPPELSFPLPETPKQSPPSLDEPEGVAGAGAGAEPGAGLGAGARRHPAAGGRSPPSLQRQDSSSSSGSSSSNSRSSSPEPHGGAGERKPGPLTLLARKMESEGAFAASRKKGRSESEEQELAAAATAAAGPADGLAAALFPGALLREGGITTIAHTGGPVPPAPGAAPLGGKGVASAAVSTITFSAALAAGHAMPRGPHFPAFGPASARVVMATAEDPERDGVKMDPHNREALERERAERERALEKEKGEDPNSREASGGPLSSPLSPQPSSKKFRFLRDTPLLSSPTSASATPLIKRPRTFSDTPPPELPALLASPGKPGPGKDGGPREGVLQVGSPAAEQPLAATPQTTGDSGTTRPRDASSETGAPAGAAQPGRDKDQGEAERRGPEVPATKAGQRDGGKPEEERPRKPTATGADRGLSGAVMGPVLPPSPPGGERSGEGRGPGAGPGRPLLALSDSSSSDSDSASSSSHSSGSSSSSEDKTHSVPRRRSTSGQRDSEESSPVAPPCKRTGAHLDKEGRAANNKAENKSKRPCLGRGGEEQEEEKREEMEGADRHPAREVKQAAMSESPGPECEQAPESSEGRAQEVLMPLPLPLLVPGYCLPELLPRYAHEPWLYPRQALPCLPCHTAG
ncbi:hypothetical protein COCON_G00137650 [Conger conger]|uniref:SAP domain-containing protein n=1 Tax=Conger conger TaxID=82655 RepID=A0A9Q1DF89_CONCO|nr:hypothetical protein COCON_G00137650 [Conger conger]